MSPMLVNESPPDSPPAPRAATAETNRRLRCTPHFFALDEQVITRPDFRVLALESFLPVEPDCPAASMHDLCAHATRRHCTSERESEREARSAH